MDKLVVVGAGQAGGRAVEAARKAGYDRQLTLIGGEPLPPYERPQLSKDALLDVAVPLAMQFPGDFFKANDIELVTGTTATAIDRKRQSVRLSDGSDIPYDKLLLTTGAKVRDLNLPGRALQDIFTLRTAADARAISDRLQTTENVAVIGGGFIGLEVAAAAVRRGCRVTVLEFADRLMARAIPAQVSRIFADLHTQHGVDLRLNTAAERFEGGESVTHVVTAQGDMIPANLVVIGVGIDPETELAETAGLRVDNGIVVDAFCCTSDPNIYAAGDAANQYNPTLGRHIRLESWQNAQNQAIAAARNMCGDPSPFGEMPWFWSDQHDVNLQLCGAPDAWDYKYIRGDLAARDGILFQYDNDRLTGALSINRARDMRLIKRLMDAGKSPPIGDLIDDNLPLRELLKR